MWIRRLSELALVGWLGLVAADARAAPAPSTSDDSLAASRERFKQGMDLYEHGEAAAAIACWEPIYRDLGAQRGYRLAYNLGVAYAALDDTTHSADRLQAFLTEVDARRGGGEALGVAVTNEESDARSRLARLTPILGRVEVPPSSAPSVVRVDAGDPRAAGFVAWVAPGQHTVTFDPGTRDERTIAIEVAAGAIVELLPPQAPPAPAAPLTAPAPAALPAAAALAGGESPRAPIEPSVSRPPFSPALIAIGGGITLAAAAAAIALELHANTLHDRFTAEQANSPDGTIPNADRTSFATARTWAYVAVGGAAGLAAATGGLVGWYLLGRRHAEIASPNSALAIKAYGSRFVLEGSF